MLQETKRLVVANVLHFVRITKKKHAKILNLPPPYK